MNITKEQLLEKLCLLCSTVGAMRFDHKHPHDCFCEQSTSCPEEFLFEEGIVDYIIEAVEEKLLEDEKYL